jgi:predicted  nucleic acid-binding Zn-ribbon protein
MGPTNIALVQLYQADQALREAQGRLEAATKNVRIQERRVRDLEQKLGGQQQALKEQQTQASQLELDIKTRDQRIERLRSQQQAAKNNKEYQAFLIEINTEKVDRNKSEEQALKVMEQVERGQAEIKELGTHLEAERAKAQAMKDQMGDTVTKLQAEIDGLQPARDAAAAAVPPKALAAFERLADRFEGEAMSALAKPDRRREEYVCTACMMDLVTDVYNKLHARDELMFCPSCHRILYIPDELPPETAVNKKKTPREKPAGAAPGATTRRQESAVDVLKSLQVEQEPEQAAPTDQAPETSANSQPGTPESLPSESTAQEGDIS